MSSTLAGNLTILGSVANLIVVRQARYRVKIGFWQYFRVGAPVGPADYPVRRRLGCVDG
jgi:Na+/H+ antiporter NhaD/arsenite permease-like protein